MMKNWLLIGIALAKYDGDVSPVLGGVRDFAEGAFKRKQ
jgi:hypothetical protein